MTAARLGWSPSGSNRSASTGAGALRVEVLADGEALARRAADEIENVLGAAIERRGRASFVLAGGSTPRRTYELLACRPEALDWRRVDLFWGDERCVAPDSAASNYRLAQDTLLAGLPVPDERVHRVQGELAPAEAAGRYATEVESFLAAAPFDLVLLGLGADGHVASLFPGALPPPGGWVAAVEGPVEPRLRVTLTPRALARCRRLVYLVRGDDKAPAVARALAPAGARATPCGLVRPDTGSTLWLLDQAAGADLRA